VKAGAFGLTTVIDQSEEFDTLCGESVLNPFKRLVYRMAARYRDDAIVWFGCHESSSLLAVRSEVV
jgi:hypothetical protein